MLLLSLCAASLCIAEEVKDDSDPSKVVALSIREEYYNLTKDAYINRLVIRKDKALLKNKSVAGRKGLTLRWDLPIVTAHFASQTKTGLGDLYFQGLLFPYLRQTFFVGAGTGFILPTATGDSLGQGKWQVAPLVVPMWLFPKQQGFFNTKIQDIISFAGDHNRRNIHSLLVTPTVVWRVGKTSWILADTEARINWNNNNRTDYKSGLQIAKMFTRNLVFWVKPEIPWGPNRQGDWTIKVTMVLAK